MIGILLRSCLGRRKGAQLLIMTSLSHITAAGEAHMVDVSDKADTKRLARARGRIVMAPETLALAIAGCATAPQVEADLTPPPRKPFDAKTQLESGRVR